MILARINKFSFIAKYAWGSRGYCKFNERVASKTPKEISIPVPYGCITGKQWNKEGLPIIGLHGWMDNAGAWDEVAPLLPESMSLISIDLPGHGLSTFPYGNGSTYMDFVVAVERVVQHFGMKEVNFLSHSMGGNVAFLYSAIFPKKVKKILTIDMIKPISVEAENQPGKTAKSIQDLLETESRLNREPVCYDYETMLDRLIKGYNGDLTQKSAKVLLKRNSKRHENGQYYFTFDPRIKVSSVLSMTFEQQKAFARKLECEMMIIKASRGTWYEDKSLYDEILKIYEESAKNFKYMVLEGNHYIHLNNPEIVAPVIIDYFQKR